jgi:hypothetical protein
MEEDLAACLDAEGRPNRKEVIRCSIPMPIPARKKMNYKRFGYCFVAPAGSIDYSEEWGGKWSKWVEK